MTPDQDISLSVKGIDVTERPKEDNANNANKADNPAPSVLTPGPSITVKAEDLFNPPQASFIPRHDPYGNEWFGKLKAEPSQVSDNGIKYDFNTGLRIIMPKELEGCRLVFGDSGSHTVFFDGIPQTEVCLSCTKKYYIKYYIRVYDKDDKEKIIFEHNFDAKDKPVLMHFPSATIGDTIAWFSYVPEFQKRTGAKIYCCIHDKLSVLFKKQYPEIEFISPENFTLDTVNPYATYRLGLWFDGNDNDQANDFRYMGLHHAIGDILGIESHDYPPEVDLSAPRKIKEKYVCIAAQASSLTKCWTNPEGWINVIKWLKEQGYRVLCIDKDRFTGNGIFWNIIPNGAEDFTGDMPLQERIDLIKDADFFIGASSGLSWLAWCCKVPVVLISGFTQPENEFYTPYRVINRTVCHGCWNDMRETFDHSDCLWCPRHKGTPRHFECSRMISAEQVIETIKKIIE
jgi:autotransporter strand-loop-strand O-heptosyltransferase